MIARSSAQHKAIWANIRKAGGLRKVIKKIRRQLGPASESRLLYHATRKENLPSIMKQGLKPNAGKGFFQIHRMTPYRKAVWLGSPRVAKEMRMEIARNVTDFPKTAILKVRVKKKDIVKEQPLFTGREFLVSKRIDPKWIRIYKPRKQR